MSAEKRPYNSARFGFPAEAPGYRPPVKARAPMRGPTADDKLAMLADDLKARSLSPLLEGVVAEYGVTLEAVLGKGRSLTVRRARKGCYVALHRLGMSSKEIGAILGVDHSSVLFGLATFAPPVPMMLPAVVHPGEIRGCS